MFEIVKYGDDRLKQKCETITEFNDELKDIADKMYESMLENHGIGLAGPQVGILKRIVVINNKKDKEEDEQSEEETRLNLINPKIIAHSVKEVKMEEGCLSIPGVYADVIRPATIRVKAQDLQGNEMNFPAKGLLARVIQHEVDHLNGILFVEKVSNVQFKEIEPDLELIKQGKEVRPKDKGIDTEKVEI
jgi:peptide deformylase